MERKQKAMTSKNLFGIVWRAALVLVVAVVFATPARAAITVGPWGKIFSGIDHATGYADSAEPRLQKVNCLRIDLNNPYLEFYATPHSGSLETITQRTSDFLTSNGLQVAINAHFFGPMGSSIETNLDGAAVSQGNVVSPSASSCYELLISPDNHAWIDTTPSNSFNGVWTAVAGNAMVVSHGEVHQGPGSAAPRTAVGISQDDRYLYMMTIDGRQSGVSDGADYKETGEWLMRFGAYLGVNLDGGGSSTMVMDDGQGGYDLLNVPSSNPLRYNGSSIGVRVVPEPTAIALLLSGIVCLAALAVRRKLKCRA
jgi:hypothetical protein